jgi:hypothetical protein
MALRARRQVSEVVRPQEGAPLKADAAKTRFLARLEAAGLSLNTLTPAVGVEAMLAYYAEERADGCVLSRDGDMLLFQWGTNDWGWGDGPKFEVSIVRQLIVADDTETEPRQLNLRFRYEPSVGIEAGHGASNWCASPDELAEFRQFVVGSVALKAVGQLHPQSIQLWYERT